MLNKVTIIILGLFFCNLCKAQIQIKGTVSDSLGIVPFVNVLIKEKDNRIKSFSSTNQNGYYEISLQGIDEIFFLEFSSFAHEPQVIRINQSNSKDKVIVQNVKLSSRITKLKEVVVEIRKPILVKKDTTEYNPNSFKDGTERVVEDLLKKLPGIEVNEDNGVIKFKGKAINKLLLDGDDLFNSNYTIGSRNIDVDMIEKVQGLDRFDDNSLLKGIRDSDDVALNLVLKKGKSDISGSAILGYGLENEYNINLTALTINKKIKSLGVASFNTIGENNSPYNFSAEILSLENLNNYELQPKTLIGEGYLGSFLEDSYHRINNNLYLSFNSLFKLYKKSSFKINAGYSQDKLLRVNTNTSNISIENNNFTINETNTITKRPKIYDLQWYLNNKEKSNFHWEYIGKGEYYRSDYIDNSTNNSILQFNSLKTQKYNFNQNVNATYKIKENNALQAQILYASGKSPQALLTTPNTVIDQINNINANRQNSEFQKDFLNIKSSYYNNFSDKLKFGIHTNYTFQENKLNTILLDENLNLASTDFINNTIYKIHNFSLEPLATFQFTKYNFKIGLKTVYNNLTYQDNFSTNLSERKFFVTPEFSSVYKFNDKSSTLFNYTFNQILPQEEQLFLGIVQTNYRSFTSNEITLENLKTHTFNLGYNYNDFFNLTQFSANLSHNYRPNNFFSRTIINQDISVFNSFFAPISTKDFGLNISGETYWHFIRATILLNSIFKLNYDKNIVNDSDIRNVTSETGLINFTIRRRFYKLFTFQNKLDFKNLKYKVENLGFTNNLQSLTNQTKITYRNNKNNFDANIIGNFITPNINASNNYYFLEAEVNYTTKSKRTSYSLFAKNLTNIKEFRTINISDFSTNSSSHNLIERYVMLQVTFGF